MTDISQTVAEATSILEQKGLIVSSFEEVSPFPGGYEVAKPKSIPGNTRQDYEVYFASNEILCDAPCICLYPKDGKWIFELWEFMPGPGPGDFQEEFAYIIDAVPAILDYYFGDSSKMNPPELY